MNQKLQIPCPQCGNKVEWNSESAYRPFCSERCKLIDLGAWADEKHSIPGKPIDPNTNDQNDESNI